MNASGAQHQFRDNTEASQFELLVDGQLAVLLQYRIGPGVYALVHTETQAGFEQKRLAVELVTAVLDLMRESGARVVTQCPFVAAYLRKHPEYLDLVSLEDRKRFDLPPE
jgi:predicted GNAT family acetyltransferase